jgi:glutathione S-transferase
MSNLTLYTTKGTGSLAVQIVANEMNAELNIIHYDTGTRTLSNGENITDVNPLSYVPVLVADDAPFPLTETPSILSYLADKFPSSKMLPPLGTAARREAERLMIFNSAEIAQKQIPMMRKLLTKEGTTFHYNKVFTAYQILDAMLAQDGRTYLMGERFTAVDAFVWSTMWVDLSGVDISTLSHLVAYRDRINTRPSVLKAQADIEHFEWNPPSDSAYTASHISPRVVPTVPTK